MNRRIFLLCVTMMSLCPLHSSAQITLESCYRKAQANYPAIKKFELIERTKEYNIRNVNRGYLPQATFSAKATYQSDVTQLPAAIGNIMGEAVDFSPDKDQYGATIDVTQTIWDGGVIRHKKDMAESEANSKTAENDVALYAINRTVNEVYFGILLAEAHRADRPIHRRVGAQHLDDRGVHLGRHSRAVGSGRYQGGMVAGQADRCAMEDDARGVYQDAVAHHRQ